MKKILFAVIALLLYIPTTKGQFNLRIPVRDQDISSFDDIEFTKALNLRYVDSVALREYFKEALEKKQWANDSIMRWRYELSRGVYNSIYGSARTGNNLLREVAFNCPLTNLSMEAFKQLHYNFLASSDYDSIFRIQKNFISWSKRKDILGSARIFDYLIFSTSLNNSPWIIGQIDSLKDMKLDPIESLILKNGINYSQSYDKIDVSKIKLEEPWLKEYIDVLEMKKKPDIDGLLLLLNNGHVEYWANYLQQLTESKYQIDSLNYAKLVFANSVIGNCGIVPVQKYFYMFVLGNNYIKQNYMRYLHYMSEYTKLEDSKYFIAEMNSGNIGISEKLNSELDAKIRDNDFKLKVGIGVVLVAFVILMVMYVDWIALRRNRRLMHSSKELEPLVAGVDRYYDLLLKSLKRMIR